MPTRAQLAMIHIAKKAMAMDDDRYRAVLGRFGVASSKDLTGRQAAALIDLFGQWGWRPVTPPRKVEAVCRPAPAMDKTRYINKIIQQLKQLGRLGQGQDLLAYADGIAHEMFFRDQPNVSLSVEHCTILQLVKIIQALEIHIRRLRNRNPVAE
ncbi:MAG: regulatory protein GemA [Magnetococcales bacterium]|nr:regulatory protein GemA [Magnetococcales bacterium]